MFLFVGTCFQPAFAIQLEEEIEPIWDSPTIDFLFEELNYNWVWIWVMAYDETIGLDRLEIYFNGKLEEIFYGTMIHETIFEFRYPPVPFIIIKAVAYDKAGNRAEESINLREIFDFNVHSEDKSSNLKLYNVEDCDCQKSGQPVICTILFSISHKFWKLAGQYIEKSWEYTGFMRNIYFSLAKFCIYFTHLFYNYAYFDLQCDLPNPNFMNNNDIGQVLSGI